MCERMEKIIVTFVWNGTHVIVKYASVKKMRLTIVCMKWVKCDCEVCMCESCMKWDKCLYEVCMQEGKMVKCMSDFYGFELGTQENYLVS